MAWWFGRRRAALPTIDALRFDAGGWTFHGEREPGRVRLWRTPGGDVVSLHFFAIPPDIPALGTESQLRAFYANRLAGSKAKVVEFGLPTVAGRRAVWVLFKVPQTPTGMTYQGAFTIPFRDCSFVVKVQSPEVGTTGVREAVLMERRLRDGQVPNVSGTGPPFPDWDPDAAEIDAAFPTHPVSRVRRITAAIAASARFDGPVRLRDSFPLPAAVA